MRVPNRLSRRQFLKKTVYLAAGAVPMLTAIGSASPSKAAGLHTPTDQQRRATQGFLVLAGEPTARTRSIADHLAGRGAVLHGAADSSAQVQVILSTFMAQNNLSLANVTLVGLGTALQPLLQLAAMNAISRLVIDSTDGADQDLSSAFAALRRSTTRVLIVQNIHTSASLNRIAGFAAHPL